MYDIIISGGGIVGLATAYQILEKNPNCKIAVIEKETKVGQHQTGHNSGVIHSGLYYRPGSLKAKNCIDGYNLLLEFCDKYGVKYELCGKIVVATDDKELPYLENLYQRGVENGLTKNRWIDAKEINEYEPHVNGIKGIHVPYTGIIDYLDVCEKLAEIIKKNGGEILLNEKVEAIKNIENFIEIKTSKKTYQTKKLINCSGLQSDEVAAKHLGKIDTKIIPFRGEYYMLKKEKQYLVKNLIYPVPDPDFPFLGVHFTRMIHGDIEAGPNAVFAFKKEGYKKTDFKFNEFFGALAWRGFQKVMMKYWKTGMGEMYRSWSKAAFTKALQRLIPEIKEEDLIPAEAGVRAQACDRNGGLLDDFKIYEEKNAIHLLNAPSPAATSSLSIGKTLAEMVLG